MNLNQDTKDKPIEETGQTVVVFELDKEEYAVPVESVKEVVNVASITRVPQSPGYILGVANLRGRVIPIFELGKKLGLKRDQPYLPKHILIGESGPPAKSTFGVVVDAVKEVLVIPKSMIHEPPKILSSKIPFDYLEGVAVISAHPALDNKMIQKTEQLSHEEISRSSKNSGRDRVLILLDIGKVLTNIGTITNTK